VPRPVTRPFLAVAFTVLVNFVILVAPGRPASASLPVAAFFSNPGVREPRLSPDGRYIAFLFPNDGRMAVGLFDRTTQEARSVVHGTDESIQGFFWKGNDRIVFLADVGGNESAFIGSTDLTGRHVLRIAESQRREFSLVGSSAVIEDSLRFDPDHIAVRGFFVSGNLDTAAVINGDVTIACVNVRNGSRGTLYTLNDSNRYGGFYLDNAGVLRLVAKLGKGEVIWLGRRNKEESFKEIARFPIHGYSEEWEPLFFAADNETLYLISRGALYAYNTRTLEPGPARFVPPEGEILDVIASYDRRKLYGVAYETDRIHYHWFNAGRAALQQKLDNTFPGMDCRIVSKSADEQVNLVWVSSDRDPGAYFVLDLKAGTMALFKRVRDIDPRLMRPMQPITFTARDGLVLHGYLTLPAGAEGRRVPLIVNPHGGPYGIRDSWDFIPEVQFLASRGYAVLQVNYRGSGGYGREFIDKGRYQWGRAMQDDLTDAVKWAIAQGIADPARVAIYGASYGGYAAMAGVTLTPDLYRCAINYVGAVDLERTYIGYRWAMMPGDYDFQKEWIGPTREYRDATSPVNLIDRIRVPTLHAYGDNDPRVKIKQWDVLEAQLKKYRKSYVSVEEKEQGHGFRDAAASIHFYEMMERFLADNLAPADRP
jgi:dipeptidyl aminopeptidase/acylaminoacyl peptidase